MSTGIQNDVLIEFLFKRTSSQSLKKVSPILFCTEYSL